MTYRNRNIAVVISCFKPYGRLQAVVKGIHETVDFIYLVDDCCPEKSAETVFKALRDKRIVLLKTALNQGVGGATILGFNRAIRDGADLVVKIDADGQIPPALVEKCCSHLIENSLDCVKGNRFFAASVIREMRVSRLLGNFALSVFFMILIGNYRVMDVNNGLICITRSTWLAINNLPMSSRYLFETDLLAHIINRGGKISTLPCPTIYFEGEHGLRVRDVWRYFLCRYLELLKRRLAKLSADWCLLTIGVSLTICASALMISGKSTISSLLHLSLISLLGCSCLMFLADVLSMPVVQKFKMDEAESDR